MKNVFIPFYSDQRFSSLLSFAKKLNENKDINIFVDSIGLNNENLNLFYKQSFLFLNKKKFIKKNKLSIFRKIYDLIRPYLMLLSFYNILLEKNYINYIRKNSNKYQLFFIKNKITSIFLISDRKAGIEASIALAAKNAKVKIIIPYLVNHADYKRLLNNKKQIKIRNLYSYFSKIKYKKYIIDNKLFYDFYIFNALNKLKLLSKNPWVVGFGYSDLICCDSKNTKKRLLEYGVSNHKLSITGDVILDRLFQNYNNKKLNNLYSEKYKLKINKKIILISLPQLYEHKLFSWKNHISEIEFLLSSFNQYEYNVLVSLHPKMDRKKYIYLVEKFNITIIDDDLVDVLPIADTFVATYSSTIVWSVLCNISTIIVDFYNLNYKFFNHLNSVPVFKDKKLFKEYFLNDSNINQKLDFNKDWNELSKKETFDGNVIKRYMNLIQ